MEVETQQEERVGEPLLREGGLRRDWWGALGEEKDKWVPRVAFYDAAGELTRDEREAAVWALAQLAKGAKGSAAVRRVEGDAHEDDDVSSPPARELVINAQGRLERKKMR